jgi:hypothetical protein
MSGSGYAPWVGRRSEQEPPSTPPSSPSSSSSPSRHPPRPLLGNPLWLCLPPRVLLLSVPSQPLPRDPVSPLHPPEGTATHALLRRGRLTTSLLSRFIGIHTRAGVRLARDQQPCPVEQGSVGEAWARVSAPGVAVAGAEELDRAARQDTQEELDRAAREGTQDQLHRAAREDTQDQLHRAAREDTRGERERLSSAVEGFDREAQREWGAGVGDVGVMRLVWGRTHEAAAVLAAVGCVPGCVYEEATLFTLTPGKVPPGVDFGRLPPMGATPDGLLRGGEWPETVGPCPVCMKLGEDRCLVSLEVKNVCPFAADPSGAGLKLRSRPPGSRVPLHHVPQLLLEMATTGAHRAMYVSFSEGYGLTAVLVEREDALEALTAILLAVASVHALKRPPRLGYLDAQGARAIEEMRKVEFKLAFKVDSDDVLRRTTFSLEGFEKPFLR